MGARGPRSAEAAKIVAIDGGRKKIEPPDDLTDEEKAIWKETIASEPKDAFNTAALRGLLTDYCRHRATAESVSKVINSFKSEWLKNGEGARRYAELLKIRDLECRGAADKATKLRLTNQSRYTPKRAQTDHRKATAEKMPWDFDGEEEEAE